VLFYGNLCPEPDKVLIDFNETLKKIQHEFHDVNVVRGSLSFNVNMFLEKNEIIELVKEEGPKSCRSQRLMETSLPNGVT